ncbi:50S ribosomal protein L5, chloroplastic [Iris pallida]|uniref:Large ribosomal subunit protein uL5c n=1 Tax=Iris pallida TaxID=29817 RepID=A0AAX6H4G6_IRIPA|nr:50S ribosomal protein L5, chloroplastic [Iris pallida]
MRIVQIQGYMIQPSVQKLRNALPLLIFYPPWLPQLPPFPPVRFPASSRPARQRTGHPSTSGPVAAGDGRRHCLPSVADHLLHRHRPRRQIGGGADRPPQDGLPREGRSHPQGGVLLQEHPRGAEDREGGGELRDGDAEQNSKGLEAAMRDLALITGQRPVKTKAKKSIATFKLREGTTVGIAVTLRGNMMYSFLDRLINLGLPRTRDFQGVNPNSFDGHGNYSIGMRDQSVFPEIRYEALGKQKGMDVCITTTAKNDTEAQRLLALLGMPFREGAGGGPTILVKTKKRKAAHYDSKSRGRK